MSKWTEWTDGEYPASFLHIDDCTACIQVCAPSEDTVLRNRRWSINHRDYVLAIGYCYRTANAEQIVELILEQNGSVV